jgi:hypothetical protein
MSLNKRDYMWLALFFYRQLTQLRMVNPAACMQAPVQHPLLGAGHSPGDAYAADDSADDSDGSSGSSSGSSSSTMAEDTVVLRWERLAGRLAAELAGRKLQLLLYWLQLQLSFTEGCSSRSSWLSGKVGRPVQPFLSFQLQSAACTTSGSTCIAVLAMPAD